MKTKIKIVGFASVLVLLAAGLALANLPVYAADPDVTTTITVDSTGDGSDANIADNICDDGAGNCTLRAAIEEANDTPGTQTIEFAIVGAGVHTITPATLYPAITDTVYINGYSQNQTGSVAVENTAIAPAALNSTIMIEINGSAVDSFLNFSGGAGGSAGSSVRGLAINRFTGTAIHIGAHDVTVAGNYIGTAADGVTDLGNGFAGITNVDPSTASDGAVIGGLNPEDRNIISGNESAAIYPRDNWVIQGNYIGVDRTGMVKLANSVFSTGAGGLSIDDCVGVVVGGSEVGAVNVISGNNNQGIAPDRADNLVIQGNYIGVGADGVTPIPNDAMGIDIKASDNALIGGSASGEGNIINNNGLQGVYLDNGNTNNVIKGNSISDNDDLGVLILDSSSVTIGGSASGEGNTIEGNATDGIYMSDLSSDVTIQGNDINSNGSNGVVVNNSSNITIGGSAASQGNLFDSNTLSGVDVQTGASNIIIQGNEITSSGDYGVKVDDTDDIMVGGVATGAGNTISSSALGGVQITASTAVAIQGNDIDLSQGRGIYVFTTPSVEVISNTISNSNSDGIVLDQSGLSSIEGNAVGTSLGDGIELIASSDVTVTDNDIITNTAIGININGSNNVAVNGGNVGSNVLSGVGVSNSTSAVVSGVIITDNEDNGIVTDSTDTQLFDNEISGNGENGIAFNAGSDGGVVQGNTVTDNAQQSANSAGIYLAANDVQIGGTSQAARNVISGNVGQANILMVGFGVTISDNVIQGNYIGTASDGTVNNSIVQNAGISIVGLASGTLIGGTQVGAGNRIADNDGAGITIARLLIPNVIDFAPSKNTIIGNSILDNDTGNSAGLGIDLLTVNPGTGDVESGGVTANDTDDIDVGANNLMNFPVINSASQNLLELSVNIDLDTADSPTDQYRVEFFANDAADPTNYGEGQTFLGAAVVSPGNDQDVTVTMPSGTNLTGKVLSATTTAVDGTTTSGFGSTSEFSLVSSVDIIALPQESSGVVGALTNTGLFVIAGVVVGGLLIIGAKMTGKTGNNHNY